MTASGRFERRSVYRQWSGATCYRGIDPVTGLPVLIYRFSGRPTVESGGLESENIPGVLFSGIDGEEGYLVTAIADGYRPAGEPGVDFSLPQLLGAARALRDAFEASVTHGDIRPERLLVAEGHLMIEGYGVPWRSDAEDFVPPEYDGRGTLAGDVWSLARSVVALGAPSERIVEELLEQSLADDPADRPTGREFYRRVASLLRNRAAAEEKRPPELTAISPKADDVERKPPPDLLIDPPPIDRRPSVAPPEGDGGGSDEPEPLVVSTDPGTRTTPRGEGTPRAEGGFVKELPAGATLRPGRSGAASGTAGADPPEVVEEERRSRTSRRIAMLGMLVVALAVLAVLAWWRREPAAPAPSQAIAYVIEVAVEPDDLPPVDLYVVSSPPGSTLPEGTNLGTAPRRVALDRAGTWAFQGELLEQRSEVVEIEVPEERALTLVMPGPGAAP